MAKVDFEILREHLKVMINEDDEQKFCNSCHFVKLYIKRLPE